MTVIQLVPLRVFDETMGNLLFTQLAVCVFRSRIGVDALDQGGPLQKTFAGSLVDVSLCPQPKEKVVLDHWVSSTATYAVLEHFWSTSSGPPTGQDDLVITYTIDFGAQPPIQFTPAMACGQGFSTAQPSANDDAGLFSAGGKCGKASTNGGWYHNFKIPFYQHVKVTIMAPFGSRACVPGIHVIVRGYEEFQQSDLLLPNGAKLPNGARMQLQRQDEKYNPLAWVPIASVPQNMEGQMFLSVMAIESLHPGQNHYIEGCFHLYQNESEPFPGTIFATGLEDYFNSAFWFSAAAQPLVPFESAKARMYQHPNAGLLSFIRHEGRERMSAYRFFDGEHVSISSGGRLEWRVGDEPFKCRENNGTYDPSRTKGGPIFPVRVRTYTWLYIWPKGVSADGAPEGGLADKRLAWVGVDNATTSGPSVLAVIVGFSSGLMVMMLAWQLFRRRMQKADRGSARNLTQTSAIEEGQSLRHQKMPIEFNIVS